MSLRQQHEALGLNPMENGYLQGHKHSKTDIMTILSSEKRLVCQVLDTTSSL